MNSNNIPFWYYDKNGKTKISITRLYKLLNSKGIRIVQINKSWFIVQEIDNVIDEVDETYVSQLILNYIRNSELTDKEAEDVEEAYRNRTGHAISKDQLRLLDQVELSLKKDSKESCYLYYSNNWIEINPNSVNQLSYSDLDGQIWKNKILTREFHHLQQSREELIENCVFAMFIWNVSGQNQERFDSVCSMIGYLIHEYKNPSENQAVVFMDEKISDNPNGRTGKGIVMNAISKLREVVIQDGKNFTFSTRFAFQDVKHSTSVLVFDDVKRNFDSEKLFSALTDGISIEQKGLHRFRINKEDSPKILINTNYVLKGNGASHTARRCEFEFSQHYNVNNTPVDEFGHIFFSDWDLDQWNLFDNFMIICVQQYLTNGILEAEKVNVEQKKIEADTCPEFLEFISGYRVNKKHNRNELMRRFEQEYPEISGEKWYTNRQFCKWLKVYAEFMGYNYKNERYDGDTLFTFQQDPLPMTEEKLTEIELIKDALTKKAESTVVAETDTEAKKRNKQKLKAMAQRVQATESAE